MDRDKKVIRGRSRQRNVDLSKKRRETSQQGRIKLGNSTKKVCSYCRPKLVKRLTDKEANFKEIIDNLKDEDKIIIE